MSEVTEVSGYKVSEPWLMQAPPTRPIDIVEYQVHRIINDITIDYLFDTRMQAWQCAQELYKAHKDQRESDLMELRDDALWGEKDPDVRATQLQRAQHDVAVADAGLAICASQIQGM